MSKSVAVGILFGILLGIVLQFIYPKLLSLEVLFNSSLRQQTGVPQYPQYGSGSIFAVGFLTPLIFGIIGGLTGLIISKLTRKP
ncbi:hypothetical protein A2962_00555 [Candidatus Woesebacteria bacterium RIFCSPLOWO2_01_FULL_39_61]|uniref:Uncharacterized protein n=1 Tax=Candidatus Woesebacteria bacterium RIFCSPHIGHO2_02_FULL_39_13 TaxID=1802505 RepID=A0A1F7Z264_9BACT|nr:MAG: hypothetical protein A2692_04685 [Candidatus Woesebacteria bacterium RIFCSPHIGHO2_01_FULL_39_95]OGM33601.1 MAG: hypothetical protein A3D01_01440 [Candidatus Woesebacteria bacterium RIFCSPHIGHO2_02_FULL_39_13]OGM36669.1 MAG: hypothetical protein A3E13_00050 [Candidatus Woesebacteria bacterium RIFCSPHIGHO2_12_FULL_40_20]OGM68542.1 MAG: hypothetical protein A2962_00555 [Candidatus Woesebacteria bacterium RIFCSPLOWO2_01_FULL_39_61]OGM73439.1 MAG: hypothetical protein A3H19_00785 [Candidatus